LFANLSSFLAVAAAFIQLHAFFIFAGLPLLMLSSYVVGIQYQRGGLWRVFIIVAIPAAVLDVVLNYTLFVVYMLDFPEKGEYTFSKRLKRLNTQYGPRGAVARGISYILNVFAPDGAHISNGPQ
jgi:hypothetical protein